MNKVKESFHKEQFQATIKNSKSLWNVINQKLGKNGKRNKNINYIIDNSVKMTDSTNMAEHMNKVLLRNRQKVPLRNGKIKLPSMNRKSIFITPTNHIEILNIINKMENKNDGIDYINT